MSPDPSPGARPSFDGAASDGAASDGTVAQNPHPVARSAAPVSGARPRDAVVVALAVVGYVLLSLLILAVLVYLLAYLGPVALIVAAALALVPLAIVLIGIRWIDRWEPEPRGALVFAFLWGAGASVAIALIFDLGVQVVAAYAGLADSSFGALFLSLVVQAPLVEEFAKGLGLLVLFWVIRRQFDGPVDGVVYGAMIAVGFAFIENIQYFGEAIGDAQVPGDVAEIFVLRGIMSPFTHVMFTACTGIVMGFAARRASPLGIVGWFLLGLVPAIVLHAFWNGSALVVVDFYAYYLVVQVPIFIVGLVIVYFLRRQERGITRRHLQEYAAVGWFTADEVEMLSTGAGRRAGSAWAERNGLGEAFSDFALSATRLAFARYRIVLGRDRPHARHDEAELLARITDARAALNPTARSTA